jgi:hypothetical protein
VSTPTTEIARAVNTIVLYDASGREISRVTPEGEPTKETFQIGGVGLMRSGVHMAVVKLADDSSKVLRLNTVR